MLKFLRANVASQLLQDFFAESPLRFVVVIASLFLAGAANGIGLATFLPVIAIVVRADTGTSSALSEYVREGLLTVGLEPTLGILLMIIAGAVVVKNLLQLFAMLNVGFTTMRIVTGLRSSLIRNLLGARWDYFIERPIGSLANSINIEAVRSSQAFLAVFMMVSDVFLVAIYLAMAAVISWQISFLALVFCPVVFLCFNWLLGMARRSGRRQTELERTILTEVTDALQGMKPIKAMGAQKNLGSLVEDRLGMLLAALKKQVIASQLLKTQQESLIAIVICFGLYLLIRSGGLDTETLIGLSLLFYKTVSTVTSLQKRYQLTHIHESAYRSLKGVIDHSGSATETRSGRLSPAAVGPIRFEGVGLRYGARAILEDVNLVFPERGLICVIGPSGAGKTSLVDMIAGLVEPTAGAVVVGDVPLDRLDLQQWRQHIGYVPQEMFLFNESARSNLTLRSPTITDDQIWSAVKLAEVEPVIRDLPDGLDTSLGERGSKLSGGQRQRLAMARALVRDPEILILDEITSSLDPATEEMIANTLAKIGNDRLVIAITHQTAMLKYAESVIRVVNNTATMGPPSDLPAAVIA